MATQDFQPAKDTALLEKYPSLKKMMDAGDDVVEEGDGREERLLRYLYNHPQLAQLRGNPAKIVNAIDEFSAHEDFLISIGPSKGRIVKDLIQKHKPRVMVEIGGYTGYSAIDFGHEMQRQRPGERVQVWSLEFDPLYAAIAMNVVELAGMRDVIRIVTGAAAYSLKRLKEEGQLDHIDLLFVDHLEHLYITDVKVCESLGLLKSGACIAADNVVRPGAPDYVKYVRSHPAFTSHGEKGLIVPGDFEDEVEITLVK